jgi:hypothetical protein
MYYYLVQADNTNSDLLTEIFDKCKKAGLQGVRFDITAKASKLPLPVLEADTNTLVLIGDDFFFESALWHYRQQSSLGFGYIPTDFGSPIAQDLKLLNLGIAITTIKGRKIMLYQPMQVNNSLVLFRLELTSPNQKPQQLQLRLDNQLQLQADVQKLIAVYHPDHPFANAHQFEIEGFATTQPDSKAHNPLHLPFPLRDSSDTKLLFRLPATSVKIQAPNTELQTPSGFRYSLPITINLSALKLRLITPKDTPQNLHQ